jgi:hypothetical protein
MGQARRRGSFEERKALAPVKAPVVKKYASIFRNMKGMTCNHPEGAFQQGCYYCPRVAFDQPCPWQETGPIEPEER